MPETTIAVVIPTLDEEPTLARCLARIGSRADEVIVADGGSRDRTCAIAGDWGARVTTSAPSRGLQLNAGASQTSASGLLFVHADTLLPENAVDLVRRALADGAHGGGFLLRFDSPGLLYRFGSAMVNLRTRFSRLPLGDQAQFVSRQAFESLGGYREWPILEDLDFIRRLRRLGTIHVVPHAVVTSARRFERYGAIRTLANNWLIFLLYALGVSPRRLRRMYPEAESTRVSSAAGR